MCQSAIFHSWVLGSEVSNMGFFDPYLGLRHKLAQSVKFSPLFLFLYLNTTQRPPRYLKNNDMASTTNPSAPPTTRCRLLELSAELRNIIYALSFTSDVTPDTVIDITAAPAPSPALALTCKQIWDRRIVWCSILRVGLVCDGRWNGGRERSGSVCKSSARPHGSHHEIGSRCHQWQTTSDRCFPRMIGAE
jgi:hypothetical protein